MARSVESEQCSAWLPKGYPQVEGFLPCKRWGNGQCLKDKQIEAGIPNMEVIEGHCLADLREEKN